MFRSSLAKSISGFVKSHFVAHCDSSPDLIEQADATLEKDRPKIVAPQSFDNLKNTLASASVNSYDGFRAIVQKQVNLNTVVSHFYWLGSQATGQPIYQYRIIIPFDDGKLINVATDADCSSVEGEVKVPLTPNMVSKSSFVLSGEKNTFNGEVEISDDSSMTHVEYANSDEKSLTFSYMQSITPSITVGGSGSFSLAGKTLSTAVGGIYKSDENLMAFQWDDKIRVLYTRKVNPNRTHISADLLIDADGNSKMSVSAEYMLKQSRVSMSIDSSITLKSLVETSIAPGVQLQLAAEMAQLQGQYRFGYGLLMG